MLPSVFNSNVSKTTPVIKGAEKSDIYWIKYRERKTDSEFYRIYVLLKISEQNLNFSRSHTIMNLAPKNSLALENTPLIKEQ